MSLFNSLARTYDLLSDAVGIIPADEKKKDNPLLPFCHILMPTEFCITLDSSGRFIGAVRNLLDVIAPCTEESEARTSGIAAHPLFDQLDYLYLNPKKNEAYKLQLSLWESRHPCVSAVYNYIRQDRLSDDLSGAAGVDLSSLSGKNLEKFRKLAVRFKIEQPGEPVSELWCRTDVHNTWIEYVRSADNQSAFCAVAGEWQKKVQSHSKNIVSSCGNAKLISCNDKSGFTYRGRLTLPTESGGIGFDSSQKSHQMLRWLVKNQGYTSDSQAVVAWAETDNAECPKPFEDSLSLYSESSHRSESDILISADTAVYADYAKNLRKAFAGYKASNQKHVVPVNIAALEAATTGRLGVTFYQKLLQNEYLESILSWHESAKWWVSKYVKDKTLSSEKTGGSVAEYICAPSADRLTHALFGFVKGKSYNDYKRIVRKNLLMIMFGKQRMPYDWVKLALRRGSLPMSYDSLSEWRGVFDTACAVSRKYYIDTTEDTFGMELEKDRTDKDYLFGRLLAVADKLESHAIYLQHGKSNDDKRPTNAVRYMAAFQTNPARTWGQLYPGQLQPYLERLTGAYYYQNIIDEIHALLGESIMDDTPLNNKFLLGYSLQRRDLNNKGDRKEQNNEQD